VHRALGSGFPESIYQRSLEIEMSEAGLKFEREYSMPVYYKEKNFGFRRVDFLVENLIPVELKALADLENAHINQGLNYLEAYNLQVGLLINFGSRSLQFHRLLNKKYTMKK
jgi:GxxExxY protein